MCLAVAILAMLAVASGWVDRLATRQAVGTVTVNDGDTVTVNGQRIRLLGIDAPEYMQTCSMDGVDYPCGRRSREALARLVDDRKVSCQGARRDRYGRFLAVCTVGGIDVNRAMVEQGWALAYGDYHDAERSARERRAGIWAGSFDRPRDWRDSHGKGAEPAHDVGSWVLDWLRQILGLS